MLVGLKIWRYDSKTGDRALREYEVDAPEEATLLDCLDLVKDKHDGSLAYRKSCRMMICGSCGMRMDGAAVLACKVRMYDIAQEGRVPVISAMGNLPIVKDLVVDMDPFWQKMRAVDPYLQPRYDQAQERENVVSQPQMDVIHKESLCINCGCCVSECNSMESDPDFLGPAALAKGMRFVGDPRDGATRSRMPSMLVKGLLPWMSQVISLKTVMNVLTVTKRTPPDPSARAAIPAQPTKWCSRPIPVFMIRA